VLDEFVVMPNHVHGIVMIAHTPSEVDMADDDHDVRPDGSGPSREPGTLPGTVGRIVQAFKSISTHEYTIGVKERGWTPFHGKLWQRNYYERIVRGEEVLERARQYIRNNPARWETDEENTDTKSR
jgi:putative transposase